MMFSFVETRLFYVTDSIPGHVLKQIREEIESD
jgi:hypothetical protein